ncbi:MAG TPA: sugar phosphate isomerase/epimerase family protein [bacterium]|jgi:sugar phosphate isomerase/epimerase|nr:sugar phosphate isomerase/epimerase family protein [bacterium]
MKIGIDSYCYHRYFGEVYDHQEKPDRKWTLKDFINRARELKADGVSLESCFIPSFDRNYLAEIKGILDEAGIERVWAWGHPDGLEGGKKKDELDKMIEHLEYAKNIGAEVMRVVGSSLMFRNEPHQEQLERLSKMFSKAVKIAEKENIKMAMENHIDFNSEEILSLLKNVDSPYLGINFDTGNFIRVLDDPVKAAQKLGKYVMATHIKDVKLLESVPADEWYFFSSVPAGKGIVDIKGVATALKNAGYKGFLALEIDSLHPDYAGKEDKVVEDSIKHLREIAGNM